MNVIIESAADKYVDISEGQARKLIEMTATIMENLAHLDDGDLIDALNELHVEFSNANILSE